MAIPILAATGKALVGSLKKPLMSAIGQFKRLSPVAIIKTELNPILSPIRSLIGRAESFFDRIYEPEHETTEQVVDVNYGFNGGGKVYTYKVRLNSAKKIREGQSLLAPVNHHQSGKLYNTVAVVRRVQEHTENNTQEAMNIRRLLKGLGEIDLKTITDDNVVQYGKSFAGFKLRGTLLRPKISRRTRKTITHNPFANLQGHSSYAMGKKEQTRSSTGWRRSSSRLFRKTQRLRIATT